MLTEFIETSKIERLEEMRPEEEGAPPPTRVREPFFVMR